MKVTNVMAASLDSRIAAHSLESESERRLYGFVNDADREHVRSLLRHADAVITGANSIRATGTAWQLKNDRDEYPTWVVMTKSGLDPNLAFLGQTELPKWIVAPSHAEPPQETPKCRYLAYGHSPPGAFVLDQLRLEGASRVLLFGGGFINQIFYQEGLVDELKLTLCPLILGRLEAPPLIAPPLPNPVRFRLTGSQLSESHVFLSYKVLKE